MATQKASEIKKSSVNPVAAVGIGCLILLVGLGVVATLAIRFFARQIGTGIIQSAIESKTGVKTNLQDIQNGKMTITDPKTGQTVDVGSGKLPDNFPSDFPQYPGAKVQSAVSGNDTQKDQNGMWVTFTTNDSVDKVAIFYKNELASKGWTTTGTYSAGGATTYTVQKDTQEGSVVISSSGSNGTAIVVTVGTKNGN